LAIESFPLEVGTLWGVGNGVKRDSISHVIKKTISSKVIDTQEVVKETAVNCKGEGKR